jgi:hypothetical protein
MPSSMLYDERVVVKVAGDPDGVEFFAKIHSAYSS